MTPFRLVLAFLILSLLGLFAISYLPVDLLPSYQQPILTVSYALPNTNPEMLEHQVTSPLENALSTISGIRSIKSVSRYDNGRITIEFDRDASLDQKQFEAATLIRRLYPSLPVGTTYPYITRTNPKEEEVQTPFLTYTIRAPFATWQIGEIVNQHITLPITRRQAIENVLLTGITPRQVTIRYDIARLAQWGLHAADIRQALANQYTIKSGGQVKESSYSYPINSTPTGLTFDELRHLQVSEQVSLGQVAEVYLEEQPPTSYFRINGKNAITLQLFSRKNANTVKLGREIRAEIQRLTAHLPEGYEVTLQSDDTAYLSSELNKIYRRSLLSIGILTLFIALASINLRYLLVLLISLGVNLAITFLLIYLLSITIHLYTLAGLTISFGLIADNAIVMLDHLHRYRNRRVFMALLGASVTTMAALGLILFLPEEDRQNLTAFAQVIILNLGISLLIALLFTPACYRLVYGKRAANSLKKYSFRRLRSMVKWMGAYQTILNLLNVRKRWVTLLIVLVFGTPIFMLPAKWGERNWYNQTIGSEAYQEYIRPVSDRLLGGSLRLFVRNVYERSGYRSNDKTRVYVNARMPNGTPLSQMDETIKAMEAYLYTFEGLDEFRTNIYSGESARIEILFEPQYEQSFLPYQVKNLLTAQSINWGGVQWSVYGVGRGYSNRSGDQIPSFRVKMLGYNYRELEKQAEILAKKLRVHPRIQEVNTNERNSYYERVARAFSLSPDLSRLSLQHSNAQDYIQELRAYSLPTAVPYGITYGSETLPVVLKSVQSEVFDRYMFDHQQVSMSGNSSLQFQDGGRIQEITLLNALFKEERQYVRIVSFEYYGNFRFGDKYLKEVLQEMEMILPAGYKAIKETWNWGRDAEKRRYSLLILLMVAIYIICAVLFENLRQPLIIISVIPLSFIGLFLTFGGFGFYFDQGGYAAFVMLGGLVVNAAIFIVNDLNNITLRHRDRRVLRAVTGKALPILLTSGSTVVGLMPFLLAGPDEIFWFPLAAGVTGGLLFSLLLIFIVLPVWLMKPAGNKTAR